MTTVLDASAVLAFLHDEPGGDHVAPALDGGRVSTVNWSEVMQKSLQRNVNIQEMQQEFSDVGLLFEPFTAEQAALAAQLWEPSRQHGLSMADRACIALAMDKALPVLTADRAWGQLDLGIAIQVLR
ncbi:MULTISPECIES: PIN domain-containing protein [unclassified Thioalkalivibrio]|uniref:PIN domain-containing protein n=1 Tax=unclassified Thioalkalivibrio TaxID=2621013 RepID=UPI00037C6927|nr:MULTISPECIES: type II toxin-antitoxin system VapC family toxin [unclassified Thioalkalivibrio]